MIEDAEQSGELRPGMYVIEPTSGNTGIGLAMVCAIKGYHLIIIMPESMSEERKRLIRALGAELILTPSEEGMKGARNAAMKILESDELAFMPDQFKNPANPEAHFKGTAIEILSEVRAPDAFVAGIGTGGTITGVGRAIKLRSPSTLVVGVEPASSPLFSEGRSGPHNIQGIGPDFVPEVLDSTVIDRLITVKEEEAKECARRLAKEEGILAGISSGAVISAALKLSLELADGDQLVVLLPDTGERYLTTDLFGN
jgi:cysteine synthase